MLKYFYKKACDLAGAADDTEGHTGTVEIVDPARFQYPGPAPRTRETGIVMLADTVEAASKAVQPNNEAAIEKLVYSVTSGLISANQLDDSGLTRGDIRKIRESFMQTLQGRFHSRIKYAGNESLTAANTPPIEAEVTEERGNLLEAPIEQVAP